MRESFLPFSPPCLDDDEIREVTDCLRSGWLTTGPKCREFEQRLRRTPAMPCRAGA